MMAELVRRIGNFACGFAALFALSGCGLFETDKPLYYIGEPDEDYFRNTATEIDYSTYDQESPDEVITTMRPRTIADRAEIGPDDIRPMTINEVIYLALQNNRVVRSSGTFMTRGNVLLTNPDRAPSVYDPAIQESGVLFGGKGIEAALAAFDTTWNTSMNWGRNEQYVNNAFFSGGQGLGASLVQETGQFQTGLSKTFGYGGQFSVNHNVNYLGNNVDPTRQLFQSVYTGNVVAQYRQPLLAGAGAEYTRIAGPIGQAFGGITGVNQGVLIARINNDITIADFESNVRNLVFDVEQLYWDLYLAYVRYDTAIDTQNSAQATWRKIKVTLDINNALSDNAGAQTGIRQTAAMQVQSAPNEPRPSDEAQARDAYYAARAASQNALAQIYNVEASLRRLIGLPVNDGKVIRPADLPSTAKFTPDWTSSLADALTNRVELRRQKWNIKSLELQLKAAKSLAQPQLNFVSQYRVNGFGNQLLGAKNDGKTASGLGNFYGTITRNNQTGWGLGLQMSMPVGLRSAHAQVRNYELRLAKAREVLAVQEIEISHEVAQTIRDLDQQYQTLQTLYNRRIAAKDRRDKKEIEVNPEFGDSTPDELIRAIESQALAEVAYYQALVEYNKAIAHLQYRKGTLLNFNNIFLAEDDWDPEAYQDALRRAQERAHAIDNPLLHQEPEAVEYGSENPREMWLNTTEELPPTPEASEEAPPNVPNESAEPGPSSNEPAPMPSPMPQAPAVPDDASRVRAEKLPPSNATRRTANTLNLMPPATPDFLKPRANDVRTAAVRQPNSAQRQPLFPAESRGLTDWSEAEDRSSDPVQLMPVTFEQNDPPRAPAQPQQVIVHELPPQPAQRQPAPSIQETRYVAPAQHTAIETPPMQALPRQFVGEYRSATFAPQQQVRRSSSAAQTPRRETVHQVYRQAVATEPAPQEDNPRSKRRRNRRSSARKTERVLKDEPSASEFQMYE